MPRHKNRPPRRRRPRRPPCEDPGRADQLRWQREAREFIARFEAETEDDRRLLRLLISLADFLEPGRAGRLGAEGAWGVFRAFREVAEQSAPHSAAALAAFLETPSGGRAQTDRPEDNDRATP